MITCSYPELHLGDFTVGLADMAPTECGPSSEYTLCAYHARAVPGSQTFSIECGARYPRRNFLFVQRRGSNLNLVLCQLEVYTWEAEQRITCVFILLFKLHSYRNNFSISSDSFIVPSLVYTEVEYTLS